MKQTMIILAVAALFLLGGCAEKKNYDEFAKCLNQSGVVMYGSYWCPHCQNVKKEFGGAFQYMNYVECDANGEKPQPEKCKAEGIEYMPTFKFKDGMKLTGEMTPDLLAQKTGCALTP